MKAVAKDQSVRPIDIVLVELNCLLVFLLRICEQRSLHILSCRNLENCLRAHPLVNVQRNRIDLEEPFLVLFLLLRPFQPRFVITQSIKQKVRLIARQWPFLCLMDQLNDLVRQTSRIEP